MSISISQIALNNDKLSPIGSQNNAMKPLLQHIHALMMHLLIFGIVGALPLVAAAKDELALGRKDELALGSEFAPVTLIEYGSMTCGYCIQFHKEVLPHISSKYIETGHVRFIFRDFPTSKNAHRGAVAARCAGDRYYKMLDILFKEVGRWSKSRDVDAALTHHATAIGLKKKPFLSCLNDTRQHVAVTKEQQEAKTKLNVIGTPTFLINGKLVGGIKTIEEMEILLKEALPTIETENQTVK